MSCRLPTVAATLLTLGLSLAPSGLDAAPEPPRNERGEVPGAAVAGSEPPVARKADVPLADLVRVDPRAFGRSGTLRVALAGVFEPLDPSLVRVQADAAELAEVTYRWQPLYGTQPERIGGELRLRDALVAPSQPGTWRLVLRRHGEEHEVAELTVLTKVPFAEKRGGRLNGYLIGTYPAERRGLTDRYAPPAGFIEVTPENQSMQISRHLRLGQFLTKDQFHVWPKYVALDLRLIDKLELVMQELHMMGVRAERMHIMSGFRTPNYNGPGEGGRALLSRHTYGDAADIWIENGARSGYIADLNGDGRHDTRDAEVILQAVDRVEQKYPELVGGVGVYRENGARGPFVHVDVRGERSRW